MPHFWYALFASSYQPSFSLKVEQILSLFCGGSAVQAAKARNKSRNNGFFMVCGGMARAIKIIVIKREKINADTIIAPGSLVQSLNSWISG